MYFNLYCLYSEIQSLPIKLYIPFLATICCLLKLLLFYIANHLLLEG